MSFTTINPTNEKEIRTYELMDSAQVDSIIQDVNTAYLSWSQKTFQQRAACFKKAAEILRKNKKTYAELMADEMGKPLAAGGREIEKCAWTCEHFADFSEEYLSPQLIDVGAAKSFVTYEPLGVVLAIMPWNFPFWQVFRFAAPNLMAGNGALLKHSPNTTGCALAIEDIFKQAGFDANLFRSLIIDIEEAGRVIQNPLVAAVTLTGSTRAGRDVAAKAGAALKKSVLELGGSDPYVILEDADLEEAAETCVAARMNNAGQTCVAAKRLIVVESVREAFQKKIIDKMKSFILGDPKDLKVNLGPLARKDLQENLQRQVQESLNKGAQCLLGGVVPKQKGYFYPATVLTNVSKGMPAFDEELFGPVAVIIGAKDEDEAIALANDTHYGLGAAVFTKDLNKGEWIASKKLQAGNCFVNQLVKSDPRLPFGGIKQSGYGRELSAIGIHEFVNIKTVYIK